MFEDHKIKLLLLSPGGGLTILGGFALRSTGMNHIDHRKVVPELSGSVTKGFAVSHPSPWRARARTVLIEMPVRRRGRPTHIKQAERVRRGLRTNLRH